MKEWWLSLHNWTWNNTTDLLNPNIIPKWVTTMTQRSNNKVDIGYNGYYLINKCHDSNDIYNQNNYLNLGSNINNIGELYIFLRDTNNIKEAITQLHIKDSGNVNITNIKQPISWEKINDNEYTNKEFISQNITINNISIQHQEKRQDLATNNDNWNEDEKKYFNDFNHLPI